MKHIHLNRRFVKLVVLVVGLVLIATLAGSSYRLWKKRDIVSERRIIFTELETENGRLKELLEQSKSEMFIERIAREKLGLVKEGETAVLIEKPSAVSSQPSDNTEENVPNWKKWWGLLF